MEDFAAQTASLIPLLIMLGIVSGFLAGLLGIGGGAVLVPGLFYVFHMLGYELDSLMHLCVGTSLAIIIPTGFSSAYAHYRRGAVDVSLVKNIGPGIVLGVAIGTVIAGLLSGDGLTMVFAVALACIAGMMNIPRKQAHAERNGPRQPWAVLGGAGIGLLSSLMGIGGATMNVPFMTFNGVPIHRAVGSSSAMGPLIALPGALGFITIGWGASGLPPASIGYVNLAALMVIAPASVLAAPFGAALAHRMDVKLLKGIFSVFLIVIAARIGWEAFHG